MMPDDLARVDLERDVPQRPELVVAVELGAADGVCARPRLIASRRRSRRCVRGARADAVALAERSRRRDRGHQIDVRERPARRGGSTEARRRAARSAAARRDEQGRASGSRVPSSAQRKPSITPAIGFSAVQQPPGRAAIDVDRIGDRRREQPELDQERHDVADVAVAARSAPRAEIPSAERRRARAARRSGSARASAAADETVVPDHHHEQERRRRSRSRQAERAGRRERDQEPREVDLA